MERRVKERLIGATILVVLIVLIVPELLSGPKRLAPGARPPPGSTEPVRNVVVDLATKKALPGVEDAGAAAAASAAPAGADVTTTREPAADTSADATDPRTPQPPDEAVAPLPEPGRTPHAAPPLSTLQAQQPGAPLESTASPPRSSATPKTGIAHEPEPEAAHHGWAAQLGSFAARTNAEKLERRLRAEGFAVFLNSSGAGRALRYRVRVGPLADRAAAERAVSKLKKAGHQASVIAP